MSSPVRAPFSVLALLGVGLAADAGQAELLFGSPEFNGGGTSRWIAAGDLDGDGDEDFVVGNNSHQVAVLLNRGDGLPLPAVFYESGTGPRHVTLGDVDGDGDLDVIAANYGDGTLTLLRNDGFGSFVDAPGGATVLASVDQPNEVVFADFTGDTLPDIAVVGASEGRVHRNLGGGLFDAGTSFGGGFSLAAADVEGDGDLDLVTSFVGAQLWLNDGSGFFSDAGALLAGPIDAAFADLDGDADPDLVVAENGTSRVGVLRNTGGLFSAPVYSPVASGPINVFVDDLDADGDPDVAVASRQSDRVTVFANDGTGSLGAGTAYRVERGPFRVIAGDWDGDGNRDLAAAGQFVDVGLGSVSLLMGDAAGRFGGPLDYPAGAEVSGIDVGDLDGDGDVDVVAAVPDLDRTLELLNAGDGTLGVAGEVDVDPFLPEHPSEAALADLDADGDLDLAIGSERTLRGVAVAENNGGGAFSVLGEVTFGGLRGLSLELGPLDAAGGPDVAIATELTSSFGPDRAWVFANDGSGGIATPELSSAPIAELAHDLALADVDGNGALDLVTAHGGGLVQWLLNDGSGVLGAPNSLALAGAPAAAVGLVLPDLDGDSDPDLVVGTDAPDAVLVYENTGGAFSLVATLETGVDPFELVAADFDLDGDLDVAVTHLANALGSDPSLGGNVALLRNDAGSLSLDARFLAGPLFSTGPDGARGDQLAAGDVDGDGDLDLVLANRGAEGVTVLRNRLISPERAAATLAPGGSLGTDPEADGATLTDPVETQVVSPVGGEVTILERERSTPAPGGWQFFGHEVIVEAPPAVTSDPLVITFRVDASQIPPTYAGGAVRLFRNGWLVPGCAGPPPVADPDPCATPGVVLPDGDVELSVRTSAASAWNFGVLLPLRLALDLDLVSPLGSDTLHFQVESWVVDLLLEDVADSDKDGHDELPAAMGVFEALASSPLLGDVKLRVRAVNVSPFEATRLLLEEDDAQLPAVLELPPFAPGSAQATLTAFLELEIPLTGALLHNEGAVLFQGPVSRFPPLAGESLNALEIVDLLDEVGQPTGYAIELAKLDAPPPPDPPDPPEPPPPPVAVPAVPTWGAALLAGVLLLMGARRLRRGRA